MAAKLLLLDALRDPRHLAGLDAPGWEAILPLGRRHGVSGRWYQALDVLGELGRVPSRVREHLWADDLVGREHARMLRWETNRVSRALGDCGVRAILLKGAAYVATGLPCGTGRLVADIDLLVPFAQLAEVERALAAHGWRTMATDAYDEHYFRDWMHELPPMRHVIRGAVLDLHHNILPHTCRLCPPAETLFEGARAIPTSGISVLNPVDMTAHSILHGFYNGEFTNCLRDVLDVHELLSHFLRQDPTFCAQLEARIAALGIERPAFYALRSARALFETDIPAHLMANLRGHAPRAPVQTLMDWAIRTVAVPAPRPTPRERLAFRVLQARAHWIKMPPALLARHLSYKAWLRLRARFKHRRDDPI